MVELGKSIDRFNKLFAERLIERLAIFVQNLMLERGGGTKVSRRWRISWSGDETRIQADLSERSHYGRMTVERRAVGKFVVG